MGGGVGVYQQGQSMPMAQKETERESVQKPGTRIEGLE